jgi:hypothetical protein
MCGLESFVTYYSVGKPEPTSASRKKPRLTFAEKARRNSRKKPILNIAENAGSAADRLEVQRVKSENKFYLISERMPFQPIPALEDLNG